ncbi:uncharacterized protein [Clytia hemisphaerica]
MINQTVIHFMLLLQGFGVFIGIPINLLVLLIRAIKLHQNKRMSSYHIIITNLAVADLLTSLTLAFEMKNTLSHFFWPYSHTMCYVIKGVSIVSSSIDGLFILLLSFERYYGCINLTKKWKRRTILIITGFIWCLTIVIRLPDLMQIQMWDHKMYLPKATNVQNLTGPHQYVTQLNNSRIFKNVNVSIEPITHPIKSNVSLTVQNNTNISYTSIPDTCSAMPLNGQWKKVNLNFRLIVTLVIPLLSTIFFHYKLYNFIRTHVRNMSLICDGSSQLFNNPTFCKPSESGGGIAQKKATRHHSTGSTNSERPRKATRQTSTCSTGDIGTSRKASRQCSLDPSDISNYSEGRRCSYQGLSEERMLISPIIKEATPFTQEEFHVKEANNSQSKVVKFLHILFHQDNWKTSRSSVTKKPKISITRAPHPVTKTIRLKIHILYAISVALFVLWFPTYLWLYLHAYNWKLVIHHMNWNVLVAFTYVRYLHCSVNGIIYSVIDKTFRDDVRKVLKTLDIFQMYQWSSNEIPSTRTSRTASFDSFGKSASAMQWKD